MLKASQFQECFKSLMGADKVDVTQRLDTSGLDVVVHWHLELAATKEPVTIKDWFENVLKPLGELLSVEVNAEYRGKYEESQKDVVDLMLKLKQTEEIVEGQRRSAESAWSRINEEIRKRESIEDRYQAYRAGVRKEDGDGVWR